MPKSSEAVVSCAMPMEPVIFGPFSLDPENGILWREGERVSVGRRAVLLLSELAGAPGRVKTKQDLIEAAWPGAAVEESNLSVQIATLRKTLGPTSGGGEWIETIPRVGYRFIAEPPAQTDKQTTEIVAERGMIPTLAVLPFLNLSGGPEQDYFADGVVEDIITSLSRFKSFAVIARNSSFVYKGRAVDVRQVAEELGVRYILEGSVRRAGERLRITAQLVDGASGTHLWADSFDGALGDLFDFQDIITESVAIVVEPHIQAAEIKRSQRKPPESMAAYDLYLQALPKIYSERRDANEEAYHLLASALAIEPDNGPILIHAAWVVHVRRTVGWPPITADDVSKCAELARAGLDHAEGDARVIAWAAVILLHATKDNNLAMEVIRTATDTNPNDISVIAVAGVVHLHAGDVEQAIAFFHRAVRLSPIGPAAHHSLTGLAHTHMILGGFDTALIWATRSLAVNAYYPPTYWMLIAANAQLGNMAEAHRLLEEFRKIVPGVTIASIWSRQPHGDPSRLAAIFAGLRLAGMAES